MNTRAFLKSGNDLVVQLMRPFAVLAALAVVAVAVAGIDVGLVADGFGDGSTTAISVTPATCAAHWHPPKSGTDEFHVTNHTSQTIDVQLQGTQDALVFAELFTLGPGTERPLTVTLAPGGYIWECAGIDGVVWYSNPVHIHGGPVAATPGYQPVSFDDLSTVVLAYRQTVTTGLATLASATDLLNMAVDSGDLLSARQQWLVAHLDYERLGAAYDTFGPFDDEINGRADGLAGGVNDPDFTGFRRLEYGLWHGQSLDELKAIAGQLDALVHQLAVAFPHQLTTATDIPLRAHEILENALQFELTGQTDEGSHTNLATIGANIQGTLADLGVIAPILGPRDPQLLRSVMAGLHQLAGLVASYQQSDGTWTPVQSLTLAEHEQIDGLMGQLLEQLSDIPDELRLFQVGAD